MKSTFLSLVTLLFAFSYPANAQDQSTADTLSVKQNYLDEVVLSDSRIPLKRSQSGKTVIRIDEQQIAQFQGRSLAELLATQSGLIVLGNRSITGQNLRVAIRGSVNNQVLIIVDGVRIADPSRIENDFDLNFLNLNDISSIEILKGGASTLYGSAAAAGVINITTKKQVEGRSLTLGLTTGTEQTQDQGMDGLSYYSTNLNYGARLNRFFYKIGFSSLHTNGMSAVKNGSEIDAFERLTTSIQLGNRTKKFSWNLLASQSKIENDYDNIFPIEDADFSSTTSLENLSFTAQYNYAKGELSLIAGWQNTDRDYRDSYPSVFSAKNRSIELVNKLTLSENMYSVQGFLYQAGDYVGVPTIDQKDVFVNWVYLANSGLNINVGGRLNSHQTYGNYFTYSINPSYSFTSDGQEGSIKVLGSISTAFIAPSLYQLYDGYSGNIDLAPEETSSMELGLAWSKKKMQASLVFFQREEDPKIVYNFSTYTYANAPSDVVFRGAELQWENRLSNAIDYRFNYTYIALKEGTMIRLPKHAVNGLINFKISKDSQFTLNYTYQDKRQAIDQSSLDAYQLVDLRYTKSFLNPQLQAYVWLTNLFDTDYVEITDFTTKGRNFLLGVSYRY